MWPVTWPTEANENTRVARGTLSAITVGSSNLCTGPKFRAAAPNIVADQNFSVVLDLLNMFPLSETDRFSGVLPAQRPRAGPVAAILENLLEDPTWCRRAIHAANGLQGNQQGLH